MKRLYLDASCIIYIVEAPPGFTSSAKRRAFEHLDAPENRLMTSCLSRLECRIRPLREKDSRRLTEYQDFFGADRFDLIEVTAPIIERATDLRVRYAFKTPDALHLATAIEHGADAVLTGDSAWRRCTEVTVELITAT